MDRKVLVSLTMATLLLMASAPLASAYKGHQLSRAEVVDFTPRIYTRTALFPVLFVLLMLWGIGLSNPAGVTDLPSWCTPNWDYATTR